MWAFHRTFVHGYMIYDTLFGTDETGKIVFRWGKTIGGRMFRVEKASGDPALGEVTWTTVATTGRQRVVVGGQERNVDGFFRVIAMGITHEGQPSDIVIGIAA